MEFIVGLLLGAGAMVGVLGVRRDYVIENAPEYMLYEALRQRRTERRYRELAEKIVKKELDEELLPPEEARASEQDHAEKP